MGSRDLGHCGRRATCGSSQGLHRIHAGPSRRLHGFRVMFAKVDGRWDIREAEDHGSRGAG